MRIFTLRSKPRPPLITQPQPPGTPYRAEGDPGNAEPQLGIENINIVRSPTNVGWVADPAFLTNRRVIDRALQFWKTMNLKFRHRS